MGVTVRELARRVGGDVQGNPEVLISGANSLQKAGPAEITFAADESHLRSLKASSAGACIVPRSISAEAAHSCQGVTLILVDQPQAAFSVVLQEFRPQRARPQIGISPAAHVCPTAKFGADCNVFPGAYVGEGAVVGDRCDIHPGAVVGDDCRLGNDCVIYPNAVLYAGVMLGDRVILHAGAVLGADGFGYRFEGGRFHKIPQLGSVLVQDDVEIGACTTIDRGMIGPTVIGEGTKLDNLIMIGHNCELGRHNAFASQVGLAGSVTTGDYVRCAGQVGIADHVHLGKGSTLLAKAGVHRDIPDGSTCVGIPAEDERDAMRTHLASRKVPELRKQVAALAAQVEILLRQREAA